VGRFLDFGLLFYGGHGMVTCHGRPLWAQEYVSPELITLTVSKKCKDSH
jgi:hypothetical protein